MTAFEQQLTTSLRALSAQYAQAQQQVDTLGKQIAQLTGQQLASPVQTDRGGKHDR